MSSDHEDSRSQKSKAPSKTKDLSHVPCKFFKVGGCTAGASCPFSHSASTEPGQKEPCTWFVKGNCKFGHKCALAHILPGQSLAMDRKNKKAAQAAAAAAAGHPGEKTRGSSTPASARSKRDSASNGPAAALLAGGATAPTRLPASASAGPRPPPIGVPLKASISPSAPAPPLKDTDFAAFATLDEMDGLHEPNKQPGKDKAEEKKHETPEPVTTTSATKSPLPPSAPRPAPAQAPAPDFGPIGSPPNYRPSQPTSPTRTNGNGPATFSPGTSPRTHSNGISISQAHHPSASPAPQATAKPSTALLSSSPFSAPGSQSVFLPSSSYGTGGYGNIAMAASLGSGLAMIGATKWADQDSLSGSPARAQPGSFSGLLSAQISSTRQAASSLTNGFSAGEYDINIEYDDFGGSPPARRGVRAPLRMSRGEFAVDEDEMEDFLPSSLTDLLTPEERSRRMSRTQSGQPISQLSRELRMAAGAEGGAQPMTTNTTATTTNGGGLGHRYSRSVPAASLLGDLKSIWADTSGALPASPQTRNLFPTGSTTTNNTSSGTSTRFDPYGAFDADGLSASMGSVGAPSSFGGQLSPSNASAAFLPGLHHHYMSAKAKQQQQQQQATQGMGGIGRQLRAGGQGYPVQGAGSTGTGAPGTVSGTANSNSLANNYVGAPAIGGLPSSASGTGFHTHTHGGVQTTYRTTPSPFDLTQTLHQAPSQGANQQGAFGQGTTSAYGSGLGGGIGAGRGRYAPAPASGLGMGLDAEGQTILSPNARALQAHAPGQSLPQGLAAGYSRIHALPPVHLAMSPPEEEAVIGQDGLAQQQQQGSQQGAGQQAQGGGASGLGGLDGMFAKLPYSAATVRTGTHGTGAGATPPPPGLSRNVSGGRYNTPSNLLSPLSGPVMARNDDDDLFDMESG